MDETVVWQKAYGLADIDLNKTVTTETLFKIASISKTVTATALMQLYERGLFNLSDPINNYLPYQVTHPLYPDTNITFHMLLTHSSGIKDNWDYFFYFQGDSPIAFQTFLEEYLVPGGLYYDAENNFCSWEPGTSYLYSNLAVALAGYLVEVISNTSFTEYIQDFVFAPLDMNESAWFLRDLNVSHIAMPYYWDGAGYIPYGHIGFVDVPAGDLRTSPSQLIHFLTMYINNGSFLDHRLLQGSTVQLMLTPQLPFQPAIGLIWHKSILGGRTVWGHTGSDFGFKATMHFDPTTHIGVIVVGNSDGDVSAISEMLFDYAETLQDSVIELDLENGVGLAFIVKNKLNENLTDISWKFSTEGGLVLLGNHQAGSVSVLEPGSTYARRVLMLGLGKTMMTVEIFCQDHSFVKKTECFFLLFFFTSRIK